MKKIINSMLVVIMFYSSFISVLAENKTEILENGDVVSYDERYESYEDYLNNPEYWEEETIQMREETISRVMDSINSRNPNARYGIKKVLTMNGINQVEDNWCGPANVLGVVKSFDPDSSLTLNGLATSYGIYSSGASNAGQMIETLNSNISGANYQMFKTTDLDLIDGVTASIEKGYHAILSLNPMGWPEYNGYRSSGHFITVYGVNVGWVSSTISYDDAYTWDTYETNKGSYGAHIRTFADLRDKVNANKKYYIANP